MQTFVPYDNFTTSLACLDYRRLGKQRVEAMQILKALDRGPGAPWHNHPAVQMWKGYEEALKLYHNLAIKEWIDRGYNNTMTLYPVGPLVMPSWWGGPIHRSHKANLLRKKPDYYSQFNWDVDPEEAYHWPTKV